ncbi:MAG: redoxin domain-containing protein [Armatimonadota bacterium]
MRQTPGTRLADDEGMPVLQNPIKAPEFATGAWINSPPLSMSGLRGKVVLVNFWDYTCVSCLLTLPYLSEWWRRYRDYGLVVIGVHAPEFAFARQETHVRRAIEAFGIAYPVLLDNEFITWRRWANRFWPSTYLVGGDGYLHFFHYGAGNYQATERMVQHLLLHLDPTAKLPPVLAPLLPTDQPDVVCYQPTPQIYFGYRRGHLGNRELSHPDQIASYMDPGDHYLDTVYLDGHWRNERQAEILVGSRGSIIVRYRAKEVYLVVEPPPYGTGRIEIIQDQAELSAAFRGSDVQVADDSAYLEIDTPRLYQIVDNPEFGIHELRLEISTPGIAVYSLMFTTECVAESTTQQQAA